jgi:hypothetical protein
MQSHGKHKAFKIKPEKQKIRGTLVPNTSVN